MVWTAESIICSFADREVSPEANESSTVHEELGSPETGSCNAVGYQTPVDDKLRELLNAYKQESENLWGDADSSDHHTVHAISSNIEDSMIQRLEESHIEEEIFHDKDSMDAKAEDELSAVLSERFVCKNVSWKCCTLENSITQFHKALDRTHH